MLCFTPCRIHLLQLSNHSSTPGCFRSALFPFSDWRPSQCGLWNLILVHSEEWTKSAAFNLQYKAVAFGHLMKLFIRDSLGPEDTADFSEASIFFISNVVTHQHSEPDNNTDFTLLLYSRTFVVRLYCLDFQIDCSLAKSSLVGLPDPCSDVHLCSILCWRDFQGSWTLHTVFLTVAFSSVVEGKVPPNGSSNGNKTTEVKT